MSISSEDMKTRIARAHLFGEGHGVREIWQSIQAGEMSNRKIVEWAKIVAEWITVDARIAQKDGESVQEIRSSRVEAIHVGLTVTGAAEPGKDTLEDEYLLFLCATGKHGLRSASEVIWGKIANGTATQGLRELWLDHIARGVISVINDSNVDAKNRPGELQKALALTRKRHELEYLQLVEVLYRIRSKFPKSAYVEDPKKYVSDFVRRLEELKIIENDGSDIARHIREMMRKMPPMSEPTD